jgi:hypothetical protein
VLKREDRPQGVELVLAIDPRDVDRFQQKFTGERFVRTAA